MSAAIANGWNVKPTDGRNRVLESLIVPVSVAVVSDWLQASLTACLLPMRLCFPKNYKDSWDGIVRLKMLSLPGLFKKTKRTLYNLVHLEDSATAEIIARGTAPWRKSSVCYGAAHLEIDGPNNLLDGLRKESCTPMVVSLFVDPEDIAPVDKLLERLAEFTDRKPRPAPVRFVLETEYGPARIVFNDKALETAFRAAYPQHRPS